MLENKYSKEETKRRVTRAMGLVKWADHVVYLYPPFDSGENLLIIAEHSKINEVKPLAVNEKYMCLFIKKKQPK